MATANSGFDNIGVPENKGKRSDPNADVTSKLLEGIYAPGKANAGKGASPALNDALAKFASGSTVDTAEKNDSQNQDERLLACAGNGNGLFAFLKGRKSRNANNAQACQQVSRDVATNNSANPNKCASYCARGNNPISQRYAPATTQVAGDRAVATQAQQNEQGTISTLADGTILQDYGDRGQRFIQKDNTGAVVNTVEVTKDSAGTTFENFTQGKDAGSMRARYTDGTSFERVPIAGGGREERHFGADGKMQKNEWFDTQKSLVSAIYDKEGNTLQTFPNGETREIRASGLTFEKIPNGTGFIEQSFNKDGTLRVPPIPGVEAPVPKTVPAIPPAQPDGPPAVKSVTPLPPGAGPPAEMPTDAGTSKPVLEAPIPGPVPAPKAEASVPKATVTPPIPDAAPVEAPVPGSVPAPKVEAPVPKAGPSIPDAGPAASMPTDVGVPKPAGGAPKPAVEAPKPAGEAPKPAGEAPKPADVVPMTLKEREALWESRVKDKSLSVESVLDDDDVMIIGLLSNTRRLENLSITDKANLSRVTDSGFAELSKALGLKSLSIDSSLLSAERKAQLATIKEKIGIADTPVAPPATAPAPPTTEPTPKPTEPTPPAVPAAEVPVTTPPSAPTDTVKPAESVSVAMEKSADPAKPTEIPADVQERMKFIESKMGTSSLLFIDFKVTDTDLKALAEMAKAAREGKGEPIESLYIKSSADMSEVTASGLAQLEQLRELKSFSIEYQLGADEICSHIGKLEGLTGLVITRSDLTDQGLAHLSRLTNLNELGISDNQKITDGGLVHLAKMTKLQTLHLYSTEISGTGLSHLKDMKELSYLTISNTKVSDDSLVNLQPLSSLRRLWLNHTDITNKGLGYLAQLSELNWVKLEGTKIDDQGLKHLSGLANLRELDLSNNNITDSRLGDIPVNCEELKLRGIKLTNVGLTNLAHLKSLKSLDISDNEITDEAVPAIKALPELKTLSIYRTKFSDKAKNSLSPIKTSD